MPTCVEVLDERAKTTVYKVKQFIDKYVVPIEEDLFLWHSNPETKWKIHPKIEELKVKINNSVESILYHSYLLE